MRPRSRALRGTLPVEEQVISSYLKSFHFRETSSLRAVMQFGALEPAKAGVRSSSTGGDGREGS